MASTIEQTKEAILKHGNKASKRKIARELKISLDYAGLILGELERKGEINFRDGFYALISAKKNGSQYKEQKKRAHSQKNADREPKRRDEEKKQKKPRVKRHAPHLLGSVLGISKSLAWTLEKAGYGTVESLAEAPITRLMDAAKLKLYTAAQLINQARSQKNS